MSTTTATSGTSSAAPISFSGIASGLDTTSIIQKLVSLDSQPLTAMQNQQTQITNQEQVYGQLNTDLAALQVASVALNLNSTFNTVSANSTNTSVATIAASGALAGSYNLTVNNLATAQKVVSNAQTDTTSSLNLSGTIEINGKSVAIGNNQSLTSIAQSINNIGAGVTAGIVDGGKGNAYLSLTSTQTGAANQIQLADMSGNVLQSLGITTGTTAVRSETNNVASSIGYSSQTTALQTLIGATTSGNIQVNGKSVAVDFSTDSLQSIANKINASGAGANASVVSTTTNGTTSYQLQVANADGSAPTFTDDGHVLESLGVLQQGNANQLVQAQDASFKLDNATITSASNTITSAIPGATITLLSGTPASPGNTTLSLTPSTSGVTTALQNFVTAYNTVADYITSNSQIDTSTFNTGALFGDPVAQQVSNQLTTTLFQNVPGLTGTMTNLASLGMTLDQNGDLNLNTDTLNAALAANPTQVQNIFMAAGQGSNSNITFVSSGANSVASNSSGYGVNITQTATKAQYVASTAQTSAATNAETLTFGGALFGNQNYSFITNIGASLQDTVNKINADSKLSGLMTASVNSSGELELDSKLFGTPGNFTVSSNEAASADDTGIGTATQTPTTAGLDVAGTINGEAATGSGQFLTGNSGNSTTDGLELQYAGTQTGAVGTMTFSNGIASQMKNLINTFTQPATGLLATATNGLETENTNVQNDINNLNAQLTAEQDQLTTEFNNMESAIATLDAQSKSLDALLGTSATTSSSTGTSSTGSSSSSSGTSSV